MRPFSAVAVGIKGGFAGFGLEVATPLAQRVNLRAGGTFFQYSGSYDASGLGIHGDAKFRSATANVDWYPWNNSFRISPGVTIYNGNNLQAALNVPGGQVFDLGNGTYQSSTSDPIHGTGSLLFGKRTAPNITVGFGNMIPRSGRHVSVPFEVGMQYIGDPLFAFDLRGTACNDQGCADIHTDPSAQANLQQEIRDINSTIRPLRFYPILSVGVAYSFGGSRGERVAR